MDCPYYNYRKSSWGWHGGEDATQWCSHPQAVGMPILTNVRWKKKK